MNKTAKRSVLRVAMVALCAILLLGMLSVASFATETAETRYTTNGGTSWTEATLSDALAAAVTAEAATVELQKDITLSAGLSVTGGNITVTSAEGNVYAINRGSTFANSVFAVSGGATLTFANITLDGHSYKAAVDGAMISLSTKDDTVVLDNGTTIQNSIASGKNGGAVYVANGKLEMRDGASILNGSANKGGAVALAKSADAIFDMSGGLITGCVVDAMYASGAAIYMDGYATFNMSGGVITGNTSGRFGNAEKQQDGTMVDGAVAALPNHLYPNVVTLSGNAAIYNNTGYRWDSDTQSYSYDSGADIVYTWNHHVSNTLNIAAGFTGFVGFSSDKAIADNAAMIAAAATDYEVGTVIPGLIDSNRNRVAIVTESGKLGWTDAVAEVDIGDGMLKRYATLADALTAASAAEEATVMLLKDVTLTAGTAVTGGNVTIQSKGDSTYTVLKNGTFTTSLFAISGGATVTFKNIVLDGNNKSATVNGAIISMTTAVGTKAVSGKTANYSNDKVILESGTTIQNAVGSMGGAIYALVGTVDINDGVVIKNCTATKGAAVYLGQDDNKTLFSNATLNMSGGLITGCFVSTGWTSGAAVYMDGCSTFNMAGGLITQNESGRNGSTPSTHLVGTKVDGAVALFRATNVINLSGNATIRDNKGYRVVLAEDGTTKQFSESLEYGADIVITVNYGTASMINIAEDFSGSVGLAASKSGSDTSSRSVAVAVAPDWDNGATISGLIDNNSGRVASVMSDKNVCWDVAAAEVDADGKITRYDTFVEAFEAAPKGTPIKLLANVTNTDFLKLVGDSVKVIDNGYTFTSSAHSTCGDAAMTTEKVGAFTYATYTYEGVDAEVSTYKVITVSHTAGEADAETGMSYCTVCDAITAFPTDTEARYSLDGGATWTYASFADAMTAVSGQTAIVELYSDITLTAGLSLSGSITVRSLSFEQNGVDGNKIYTVSRGSAFAAPCFTVGENATLTFANITLDGKEISTSVYGAMIALCDSTAAVVLNNAVVLESGATIQNSYTSAQGGAIYARVGSVTMKDGSAILNCRAQKGGGVALGNNKVKASATFTMEGGIIKGCVTDHGSASGAAVYIDGYTTFNMSGGVITDNISTRTSTNKNVAGTMMDGAVAAIRSGSYPNVFNISGDAIIRGNKAYRYDGTKVVTELVVGADLVYTVQNVSTTSLNIAADFTGSIGFAYPDNRTTEVDQIGVAASDYAVGTIIHGLVDNNSGRVAKVTASGVICWADAEAELDIDGKITRYVTLDEAYAIAGSTTPITLVSDATLTFAQAGESAKIIENGYTLTVVTDGIFEKSDGEEITVGTFTYGSYEIVGQLKTVYVYTAINGGTISSAGLAAGADLSMRFYVQLGDDYVDSILRVTRDGKSVDLEGVYDEALRMYCFVYTDIAPQNAGDLLTAELICGEDTLDTYADYSVLKYCQALLALSDAELGMTAEKAEELRVLTRDLLEYCAMAQIYTNTNTDALVNEGITASEFMQMTSSPKKVVVNATVDGVTFVEAGLRFDNVNNLYFTFNTPDLANTKLVVNGKEHTSEEFDLVSGTTYKWYSEDLYATQFDKIFIVELYHDTTLVQTFTYSAAAYVNSKLNDGDEALRNLVKATYNYGVAARMYTGSLLADNSAAKMIANGAQPIGGAALDGTALSMSNAASGIEFSFRGKGDITLNLAAEAAARIEITVDGVEISHFLVNEGTADYTVATGLADGVHTVRIVLENGAVTLNSVSVKGYILALEADELYIEFVGSDLLYGHALYLNYDSVEDDATGSYAVLAARDLGARYLISDTEKEFVRTTDIPDLVVIEFESGYDYTNLLTGIRAAYGEDIKILFVTGVIASDKDETLGNFVTLTVDTTGYDEYPSMGGAAIQGAELAKYIRESYDFFTAEEITYAQQDIIVEVASPTNGYNSFYVYMRTSDPSGKYYIRYNFIHDYNTTYTTYGGSTGTNVSNFRIKGATCVEVTGTDGNTVLYNEVSDVLQIGEISAALKTMSDLAGLTKTTGVAYGSADDFTGGLHGDEWILGKDGTEGALGTDGWEPAVTLIVDGAEIDVVGGEAQILYCNSLIFDQYTMMYEWATSSDTAETEIAKRGTALTTHKQHFTVTRESGIYNRQNFVWQKDIVINPNDNYVQMFTMLRYVDGKDVCTDMTTFDADGRVNKTVSASGTVTTSYSVLSDSTNRSIHYGSETTGFSAYAAYDLCNIGLFSDNKITINNSYVSVRTQGDNKLYVNFKSAEGGSNIVQGESWTLDHSYGIDYVNPNN